MHERGYVAISSFLLTVSEFTHKKKIAKHLFCNLHVLIFLLDYQDSNLEKQDQNLLCYHYTIVQSIHRSTAPILTVQRYVFFHSQQTFSRFFSSIFCLPPYLKRFCIFFFVGRIKPSIFALCFTKTMSNKL